MKKTCLVILTITILTFGCKYNGKEYNATYDIDTTNQEVNKIVKLTQTIIDTINLDRIRNELLIEHSFANDSLLKTFNMEFVNTTSFNVIGNKNSENWSLKFKMNYASDPNREGIKLFEEFVAKIIQPLNFNGVKFYTYGPDKNI